MTVARYALIDEGSLGSGIRYIVTDAGCFGFRIRYIVTDAGSFCPEISHFVIDSGVFAINRRALYEKGQKPHGEIHESITGIVAFSALF